MRSVQMAGFVALMALLVMTTGCDDTSLRISVEELDFGEQRNALGFEVYNANPKRKELEVAFSVDDDWLSLDPETVVSEAPEDEDGPFDVTVVSARLDRTALAGDPVDGEITVKGRRLKRQTIAVHAAPPYEAIALSTSALNFGDEENYLEITVANVNTAISQLEVFAYTDSAWIDINRTAIVSKGTDDPKTVVVGIKRARLSGGQYEGRVIFEAAGFVSQVLNVTVRQYYSAIVVSNQSLDFALSTRPLSVEVWNGLKGFDYLEITATPSHPWIEVMPPTVRSNAPVTVINPATQQPVTTEDKQQMVVSINRRALSAGRHEGSITFRADNALIAPHVITVKVRQETGVVVPDSLLIEHPVPSYSLPYLVDFAFGLAWSDGVPLVAEPNQLSVTVIENDEDVTSLVKPVLHRGASRQLRTEIVMDYSLFMQEDPDAIEAMEHAAIDLFLPALPEESLVGVSIYHLDNPDVAPMVITPFTVDHAFVAEQIRDIRATAIGAIASGARMRDALRRAALRFDMDNMADEERFILLLAGIGDTSSTESVARVVTAATQRQVKIYAVSFLSDTQGAAEMLSLATQTGGVYLPLGAVEHLPEVMGRIVGRLESNYLLRWATLKRHDAPVRPGFVVHFNEMAGAYTAEQTFTPLGIAGDPLQGRLRLVHSDGDGHATALVRAEYVPREITHIQFQVDSPYPFDISPVPIVNGGLIEHWDMMRAEAEDGTEIIDVISPDGSPLPFATFGGMLRFTFDGMPEVGEPLFELFEVVIPEYVNNGQYFSIVF